MEQRSPYQQLRQIEFVVQRWRPGEDAGQAAQKAYEMLWRRAQRAAAVMKDYEELQLSDDTRAQLRILPKAVQHVEAVRESLLKASEYDIVGAVDVAQLSAELDELRDRLR